MFTYSQNFHVICILLLSTFELKRDQNAEEEEMSNNVANGYNAVQTRNEQQ